MIGVRACFLASLMLTSCAPLSSGSIAKVPVSAQYVAMGSSFASGPGVNDNYARQVARSLNLNLVDVSCGGATTNHVLNGWNELPPQIAALTLETRFVTVTIGGNDIGYISSLFVGSCTAEGVAGDAVKAACAGMRARMGAGRAQVPTAPDETKWALVETGLQKIAAEVKRRAPRARLIFVEYLTVVPAGRKCAAMPLSSEAVRSARDMAARLARVTQAVALKAGAEFLPVANLSRGHDACAKMPWTTGFVPAVSAPAGGFVPYHPNLAGMTAVAKALIKKLS
jgi:lysophospholipase L1-like esterase